MSPPDGEITLRDLWDKLDKLQSDFDKSRFCTEDDCGQRMETVYTVLRGTEGGLDVRVRKLENWRLVLVGAVLGIGAIGGLGGFAKALQIIADVGKAIL